MSEGKKVIGGIIVIAAGIYCIVGAVRNHDSFFDSRKSRPFVQMFGRTGARIFYAVLGLFTVAVGIIGLIVL